MPNNPQAQTAGTPQEAEKMFTAKDVEQLFKDYMVPIHADAVKALSNDLSEGKMQALTDYVKTTAMGLYPTLAAQIKAGIPTIHLTDPYRQVAKQVLGSGFEPDFVGDPKSMRALQGNVDPETGRPAPMSLDQWRSHLMSERSFGWEFTPAAHEAANRLVQTLNDGFSQRPTGGN